jgi:hypothetical protein
LRVPLPTGLAGYLVFPNSRPILIFGIREQEIGIPEIISYSVFL